MTTSVSLQQGSMQQQFFVRRADLDDIDTITALFERTYGAEELTGEAFSQFYGTQLPARFVALIETSFLSVTVEDEENHIVGFAALDDVPARMVHTPMAGTNWEEWFSETYGDDTTDGVNSLWFSCYVADLDRDVMSEILRTTFSTMPEIQNLLLFIPGGIGEADLRQLLAPYQTYFKELEAPQEVPAPWVPQGSGCLACRRQAVITPLFIRMARVEDHDNLVAVFNAQSEVVTDIYGEYFIAELIEAQNEENKALVAEVDGGAVGLMCLTSDVDVNVLAQCFQLDAMDNLLKPQYAQKVRDQARRFAEGNTEDPSFAIGDYMQAGLASIEVESLLESIPKQDDGRIYAVNLLGTLQMQEFADDIGEALREFPEGVMTILWQVAYEDPMFDAASIVEVEKVTDAVTRYLALDIHERKATANKFLSKWDDIVDVFKQIAIAEVLAEAQAEEEESKEAKDDKGKDKKKGSKDKKEEEPPPEPEIDLSTHRIKMLLLLRELSATAEPEETAEGEDGEEPLVLEPLFTYEDVAKLLLILHWWGGLSIGTPLQAITCDEIHTALQVVNNSEEGLFLGQPYSPTWLANIPQHAKDVFCVNLCCLDQAYQTQALDFLLPAFSLYPDKDYCIITQPHTAHNTPLLNAFTIVPPQPTNTFSHVLYMIHRAALLAPPKVRPLQLHDLEELPLLLDTFDQEIQNTINQKCQQYIESEDLRLREDHVFVAEFDEQMVGLIAIQQPNPETVETLRCCYHLDDYLLVEHHDENLSKGHGRLCHWVINPLFQKYSRRLLQCAMRLCGRSVLYMEMDLLQTVSPIFKELLQVAPRRPPALKKVKRKPPKVASFVNVEKEPLNDEELLEIERQELVRNVAQTKALSLVTKKLLSETKIPVNARIVVVGASDCGLSFLESLLYIPHLLFNSLTLLAPGGLEYHHSHHLPLIAGSAAYSHHELRRIMLEYRVRILDSRMVQIDRQQRCVALHDGAMLPYDYLIVAAGLQDDALHSLQIRSWGVEHVTEGYRHVNGALSAADPSIRDLLVEGGTLIKSLIWNPLSYAVVYGRSLDAYCVVQGLLMRKVPPTKIILVLPPRLPDASHQLPVDAFHETDVVESKIHFILQSMGVKVYDGYKLLGVQQDNRERLKALVLEDHSKDDQTDAAAAAAVPQATPAAGAADTTRGREGPNQRGVLEDFGVSPDGLTQKLLSCRILLTADSHNVDPDVFNAVHGNGLVYDGRLIVDHQFRTTDPAIFGAGSLCEFSRRFRRKNGTYLRHDGFNGREVGTELAHALLRILDPVNGDVLAAGAMARPPKGTTACQGVEATISQEPGESALDSEEAAPEKLPEFYMPIARGGLLPGYLHYYQITSARRMDAQANEGEQNDRVIVTDTLNMENGTGHFCRLTVDFMGKVDSITYLGGEELQVESLWSLVGLSETFLNHLYVRWRDGDIPDIVEFLTDEWATALFHDRFMDFCHQIKMEMATQEDVKNLINKAIADIDVKQGLSRQFLLEVRTKLPQDSVKQMQDRLLEYLRRNTNHLKTYFLPENWGPGQK